MNANIYNNLYTAVAEQDVSYTVTTADTKSSKEVFDTYRKDILDTTSASKDKTVAKISKESNTLDATNDKESNTKSGVILSLSEDTVKKSDEDTLERLEKYLERLKKSADFSDAQLPKSKKRLNYQYKKVSTKIMKAKDLVAANEALSSATANYNQLRRKSGSNNYDEDEIAIALIHAKKMVLSAKKKVSNIKSESEIANDDMQIIGNFKKKTSAKAMAEQSVKKQMQTHRQVQELEDKLESLRKQNKKADRGDENIQLMNADMEYLRYKIELMKQGGGDYGIAMSSYSDTGVMNDMSNSMLTMLSGESAIATQTAVADSSANASGSIAASAFEAYI